MAGTPFRLPFVAQPAQIDELGHLNNVEWLRWVQTLSTEHWRAVAPADHVARYIWVVTRHEIDYRRNIVAGDRATGITWIEEGPRGARFTRLFRFEDENGRTLVEGSSTWAMIELDSGRIARIPASVAEPFLA